jgi:predicted RNase H-like HicB family nuclease
VAQEPEEVHRTVLTTVSTRSGLLRVHVHARGGSWVARLVDPPSCFEPVPAALGASRDDVLAALQGAVRALDAARRTRRHAVSPGSSGLCP